MITIVLEIESPTPLAENGFYNSSVKLQLPCLAWRVWRIVCQKQNHPTTTSEYLSNIFSQNFPGKICLYIKKITLKHLDFKFDLLWFWIWFISASVVYQSRKLPIPLQILLSQFKIKIRIKRFKVLNILNFV